MAKPRVYACLVIIALVGPSSFAQTADVVPSCNESQISMSQKGFAEISKRTLNSILNSQTLFDTISAGLKKTQYSNTISIHKGLLGLDFGIRNFSNQTIRMNLVVNNFHLDEPKLGEPQINCTDLKCDVHLPVLRLGLTADVTTKCVPDCKGKEFGYKKLDLKVAPPEKENANQEAYFEFTVKLGPGRASNEFFVIDRKSFKVNIPPGWASLKPNLGDEEQAQVEQEYDKDYLLGIADLKKRQEDPNCYHPPQVTPEGMQLAQDVSDVQIQAGVQSLKPYVANYNSFFYLAVANAILQEKGIKEAEDLLNHLAMPTITDYLNGVIKSSSWLQGQIQASIPVITPQEMLGQPIGNTSFPSDPMNIRITETSKDRSGNILARVTSCDKNPIEKAPNPSASGSALSGVISIEEINRYLDKVFSNPELNAVYFDQAGHIAEIEGDRKLGLKFNTPPHVVSTFDPATGKYRLQIALDVTKIAQTILPLRAIPFIFGNPVVKTKVSAEFGAEDKNLQLKIDHTILTGNAGGITDLGPFSNIFNPTFFLETAILHFVAIPAINQNSNIKDPAIQSFSLEELRASDDGRYLYFATKIRNTN